MVNLKPSAITIDVSRIRSTLEGIVNIEVIVFKPETGTNGYHDLESGGKDSVCV
jgi:hypothetical protein